MAENSWWCNCGGDCCSDQCGYPPMSGTLEILSGGLPPAVTFPLVYAFPDTLTGLGAPGVDTGCRWGGRYNIEPSRWISVPYSPFGNDGGGSPIWDTRVPTMFSDGTTWDVGEVVSDPAEWESTEYHGPFLFFSINYIGNQATAALRWVSAFDGVGTPTTIHDWELTFTPSDCYASQTITLQPTAQSITNGSLTASDTLDVTFQINGAVPVGSSSAPKDLRMTGEAQWWQHSNSVGGVGANVWAYSAAGAHNEDPTVGSRPSHEEFVSFFHGDENGIPWRIFDGVGANSNAFEEIELGNLTGQPRYLEVEDQHDPFILATTGNTLAANGTQWIGPNYTWPSSSPEPNPYDQETIAAADRAQLEPQRSGSGANQFSLSQGHLCDGAARVFYGVYLENRSKYWENNLIQYHGARRTAVFPTQTWEGDYNTRRWSLHQLTFTDFFATWPGPAGHVRQYNVFNNPTVVARALPLSATVLVSRFMLCWFPDADTVCVWLTFLGSENQALQWWAYSGDLTADQMGDPKLILLSADVARSNSTNAPTGSIVLELW